MVPTPKSKPQATRSTVLAAAQRRWREDGKDLTKFPQLCVVAVRGYYRDTMGAPGANDVGMNDDAFFILHPNGAYSSWNGNTDPARYGWNANAGKYMARLKAGCWKMIRRMHRGKYWAFGQEDYAVTVDRMNRDGSVDHEETGCIGIDLHKQSENGVSSEGCLTIFLPQWPAFYAELKGAMEKAGVSFVDVILTEEKIS